MLLALRSLFESGFTGTIGVDYLTSDADGSLLVDEDSENVLYTDGATLGIGTQAVQTGAVAGSTAFRASGSSAQTAQSAVIAARERFLAVVAGSQTAQTESDAGREDFIATLGATQASPTANVIGRERFLAAAAAAQAAQSGAITGTASSVEIPVEPPVVEDVHRHGVPFARIPSRQKVAVPEKVVSIAAIRAAQSAQTTRLDAATNDDELTFLYLELAA